VTQDDFEILINSLIDLSNIRNILLTWIELFIAIYRKKLVQEQRRITFALSDSCAHFYQNIH